MSSTASNSEKLFAVYLGGRAEKCQTELHDVVFVVGANIEATYPQLRDKWFGSLKRLHLDAYLELKTVDGHRVELKSTPPPGNEKHLYFVNLGAYLPGKFTEVHENAFLVAADEREVKSRAKASLCLGMQLVHTDDLYEIDDIIAVGEVDGYHLHLTPTREVQSLNPTLGYFPIP